MSEDLIDEQPCKYEPATDMEKRLENNFSYHRPKDDQQERYESLRAFAKEFAYFLCHNCPPSRELSVALTELESAVMWANAAIARNE